jgi:hypothetical protein
MRNSTRVIALATVGLALAAPARAQNPAPDPLESATIRIGSLGINPSLVLQNLGRDNNVFNEHVNPKSDFTFTLTPRADVFLHPRGVRLTFTTASDLVYYQKYTSERSTNDLLQARAELDLWRFQPFASISARNTHARYNEEIDTRAHHRDHSYSGGLRMRLGTRATVSATLRRSLLRFDGADCAADQASPECFRGQDLATTMNSRIDAVEGAVGFDLTPITSFSLAFSQEQQRFDSSRERDSDSLRFTPTLSFSPDGLLRGSASLGYRRFTPKSAALAKYAGLVAGVNLGATLYGRHKVDANFSRDIRYSYETDPPYYLATGVGLTWTTKLVGPMDVRLTGQRQLMDYREAGIETSLPNDIFTSYGGGFGYTIRENFRVGLDAEWSQRRSDRDASREYDNRRIFASMTWGKIQ